MPIGQGPEPPTYNPEKEKEQNRLEILNGWWDELDASQRKEIFGEEEDIENDLADQKYCEEWDGSTLAEKEEIHQDNQRIY